MNLDKGELARGVQGANGIAVLAIGADEAGHGDNTAIGKQLGHFADAANVLLAVSRGETEVFIKTVADVIAIEHVGQVAILYQGMFQGKGDGALAGTAQASEPEGGSVLPEQLAALLARYVSFVPRDIG